MVKAGTQYTARDGTTRTWEPCFICKGRGYFTASIGTGGAERETCHVCRGRGGKWLSDASGGRLTGETR